MKNNKTIFFILFLISLLLILHSNNGQINSSFIKIVSNTYKKIQPCIRFSGNFHLVI
jgi:hypothetical protein